MNKLYTLEEVILIVSFVIAGMIIFGVERAGAKDINVMVIDSGIGQHKMLAPYVKYTSGADYTDTLGHGTHVAGIIAYGNNGLADPLCKRVKIYSCKYYFKFSSADTNLELSNDCINQAVKMKMDYINYSGGGPGFEPEEYKALRKFKGKIFVSAGNEGKDLQYTRQGYYPASYPLRNIVRVMATNRAGELLKFSNRHPAWAKAMGDDVISTFPNNEFAIMSGTSQATPQILHEELKKKCGGH